MKYFEDFADELHLNIMYNAEIKSIARDKVTKEFILRDQSDQMYKCSILIMG